MKAKDGGSAFPQIETTVHMEGHAGEYTPISDVHSIGGMTLRDYFAAKSLPAVIRQCASEPPVIRQCASDEAKPGETFEGKFARISYEIADAMLAAREVK